MVLARTRAQPRPAELSLLAVFPLRRFSSQGEPAQNGPASTGKLNYSSVCCGNRSMCCSRPVQNFADQRPLCENSRGLPDYMGPNHPRILKMKRFSAVLLCLLTLTLFSFAQPKAASKKSTPTAPDKAYLQKVWDGWATLDPANVAKYY